jgi:hypothetical protein
MYKFTVLLILAINFLFISCSPQSGTLVKGSGKVTTETRSLSSFHEVELGLPGDMEISIGNDESVTIEAEENLIPLIDTKVSGGILKVGLIPGASIQPTKPIKFLLTAKALDKLETNSLGSITAPALSADDFKASINSSGNIELAGLQSNSLLVEIQSIGSVKIEEGAVTNQTVTISSAGGYTSPDLKSRNARVKVESSGDAVIWVTDSLDVVINSSGSVGYYGSPKVKSEINSSGTVQPLGEK